MSEVCPVCGKCEWEPYYDSEGLEMEMGSRAVHHIPCVLKARECAMLMKERYQDAESELADCAKTCGGLEYRIGQAEARVLATEEDWKNRQNEARELLAKKDAHIEDCHRAVEQAEAELTAQQALLSVVPTARGGKS